MQWTRPLFPMLAAGLAFTLAGCDRGPATPKQPTGQDPAPGGTAQVTLKKADTDQVMNYIKSQKGKVVVVDLWNFL